MYRLAILIAILLLSVSTGCSLWESTAPAEPQTETGAPEPPAEPPAETPQDEATPNNQLVEPAPGQKPVSRPPASPKPPRDAPKPVERPPDAQETPPSPPRNEPPAPAADPAPVTPPDEPRPVADPRPATRTVVLDAGTPIEIRLASSLSSDNNTTGQQFEAILDSDLAVEGQVLARPGARVVGRLKEVLRGGKVKGKAEMTLGLTGVEVGGEMVAIETNDLIVQAESSTGKDTKLIGIATGIGAAVGAIVGGGKGAAIGGAIGGGAGTARVLTTRGKVAGLKKEQLLGFRIEKPVSIQVAR